MEKNYETVIGLEVHVELATKTKIFCGCSTAFGGAPNSHSCPVCSGMPGSLPVLNRQVVQYAMEVGLAAHCEINQHCKFDRKNYFYPDNPQNYQISQLYEPICRNGWVEITKKDGTRKKIRIHEIHMEEDAGKLVHDEFQGISYVDFNRSGVPLIEIVSEPDMRDDEEVIAYLEALRMIAQYTGASDCKLQEGSMRADVNLSVREAGSEKLGTRTETKNLSSFAAISHMIKNERERQIDLLSSGQTVTQETRHWNEDAQSSYAMRSKENAQDYRYFPEPDIPPIVISNEYIASVRSKMPELPDEKRKKYSSLGLSDYDTQLLCSDIYYASLFEKTLKITALPKVTANWITGEVMALHRKNDVKPDMLAEIILLSENKKITREAAKETFSSCIITGEQPTDYVKRNSLEIIKDESLIKNTVTGIINENPKAVEEFRQGKDKALNFLVGQCMRALKGKASAEEIRAEIIKAIR